MLAIYKRELRSFFHGMMGYLLTAFLLAASGIYFLALNLGYGLTDFGYYTLYRTIFMLLLYFPVLAMRSLAEERRARTTSSFSPARCLCGASWWASIWPLHRVRAALSGRRHHDRRALAAGRHGLGLRGEFRRAAVLFPAGLCGHCRLRVLLRPHGEPDHRGSHGLFGSAADLYDAQPPQYVQRRERRGTGVFTALSAGASLAVGLRTRSFTLGCFCFAALCAGLSALFLLRNAWLTEAFSAVLSALCLFAPFEEFVNNSFSIPTLVYYLTVTVLFLFFTAQDIEKRRWN